MREDLRERREKHLLYVRMGIPFMKRCRRLANNFDTSLAAVKKDDTRMDDWVDDVANTASFEKKAGFLLYQYRSQVEGKEQLARNAKQRRQDAKQEIESLKEELEKLQKIGPAGYTEPQEYYDDLMDLRREISSLQSDVFQWAREERINRSEIASETKEEVEIRQSLGEIEKVADELHIQEESVTEHKVYSGMDLSEMPGVDEAEVVGAQIEPDDPDSNPDPDLADAELEEPDPDE